MPVICDSTKEKDIEELFEQIKREQKGRLDMLVNNAYAGVQVLHSQGSVPAISHSSDNTKTWRVKSCSRISLTTWAKSSGKPTRPCGTPLTTPASGTRRRRQPAEQRRHVSPNSFPTLMVVSRLNAAAEGGLEAASGFLQSQMFTHT